MIDHTNRYVFIHVPKTGGVSLYALFKTPRSDQHHQTLIEHERWKKEYFKFCFVRNTWDRFLSAYFYLKKYGRYGFADIIDGQIVNKFSDFKEFVKLFHTVEHQFLDRHFYSQTYWIDDRLDFIGRFENLQNDIDFLFNKIGVKKRN